jgi:serine/threonine protein kinase
MADLMNGAFASQILMYQLCKGVAFVHSHGVLHRDLKPHNLLMDRKTMALKIADLGLSRAIIVPLKKYTHEVNVNPCLSPSALHGCFHFDSCSSNPNLTAEPEIPAVSADPYALVQGARGPSWRHALLHTG